MPQYLSVLLGIIQTNFSNVGLLYSIASLGVFVFLVVAVRENLRAPRIHARHRITTREYYEKAFTSGLEVYMVSIMSQHTRKEIESRLQQAKANGTRLKVLTLDPDLRPETIEAIRLHLNENKDNPARTVEQVREAWEAWSAIAEKYSHDVIQVRKYRSMPTMQGILVKDKYVSVELVPYDTQPADRPGTVLIRDADRELFNLFQDRFIRLWQDYQE